jgi:hypothetical protein
MTQCDEPAADRLLHKHERGDDCSAPPVIVVVGSHAM